MIPSRGRGNKCFKIALINRRLGVKTRHSKKSTFQERQKTIFRRNLTTSVIEVVVIGLSCLSKKDGIYRKSLKCIV